jgi:UPF0755 protein
VSDLGLGEITERHGHRAPKHKRGRAFVAVFIALAIVVGAAVFAYVKGVDLIQDALSGPEDYSGDGHGSVVVEVQDGDTATEIGQTLNDRGVVASVEAFTDVASADSRALTIQVGFYTLRKQMSAESALDLLLDPKSKVTNLLTIPEGLRADEILATIVKKTDFTAAQVRKAAADPAALGLPGYAGGDLEGYLFPSTYDVAPNMDARGLLSTMVEQFGREAEEVDLEGAARRQGLSPGQLVTVASLVQAETRHNEDMPKVAAVVYNRLEQGMPLQFDSTLHYAAESRGEVVAGSDLRNIDSPYNTYRHTGLPPGPIASPGAAALAAAASPSDDDYLYFVTVDLATGETRFAETLAEHNRNVAVYHQYCQTSDEC